MLKRYAGFALIAALAAPPGAQPQAKPGAPAGQLDGNPTLFVVLAAANALGYDAGIDSPSNSPLRRSLRDRLAKAKLSSLDRMRGLLRDARPRDPAEELNRYIEFSILSAGPPDFKPIRSDLPRPADLASLDELPPLLADFYKEANIADLWKEVQPQYDDLMEDIGPLVRRAVVETNGYLQNDSGYLGRRFLVWAEPLGAPNQVQSFTYMDDYNVVVTPFAEAPSDDLRHAYLHYLLEPIATKYSAEIQTKAALYNYAQNAPLVADLYTRSQFVELATECFIKAVESRILHKPALVDQALREGYVLTPAFAEQLVIYEKQDSTMRIYFPDMVEKIDVKREQKRLANVKFATERAVRTVHVASVTFVPAPPLELTGVAKTLDDAEKMFNQHVSDRKLDGARELFLRALQESDLNPMHAKAYYGLARVAMVDKDLDTAERLYRKVLELDPDPGAKSWSLFYLGKLSDNMRDGRDQAVEFYKSVLTVAGAPDQVRQLAEQGINQASTNKK